MSDDPYADLILFYDAENAGFDEDIPFYAALAAGGKVLDAGCGTGRVALQLAAQGLQVTGVDRSAVMLAQARERTKALDVRGIEWVQTDLQNLDLGQQFDLVAFPYNGLIHLLNANAQIEVLKRLLDHCCGALALDLPNPIPIMRSDEHPGLVVERIFEDEAGRRVFQQTMTTLDRATQHMDVTYVYDRVEPDGVVTRKVVPMAFRLIMPAEIMLMLRLLGREGTLYGDYDRSAFSEDSPRLVVTVP